MQLRKKTAHRTFMINDTKKVPINDLHFFKNLTENEPFISQYSAGCRTDTQNSIPSKDRTPLATGPREVLQNRGGLL